MTARDLVVNYTAGLRDFSPKRGDVLVMVGTTKGAFLLRSDAARSRWDVAGPYFKGESVYALACDTRQGRNRVYSSGTSMRWGTLLRTTDDFGKTWTNPAIANVRFPENAGVSLKNIWQIAPGRESDPQTLYCGVEPAALFESHDAGETWSLVRGLFDHPHRPQWMPGGGGLALHTIVLDPAAKDRMYVAISAAGVYATEDSGRTWQTKNRGVRAQFLPDKHPEFGQCVHKIVMHPSKPERLFLQNHWGLYRSDDRASNWRDIANGVPSDFGFAMVMHPHDPDSVFIVPIESDEFRCTPEGRLRVYRTRDAGASWEPLSRGLPQQGAYETILRDAMAADSLDPAGIYFGTRGGSLYGSADEGKSWTEILRGLPGIVCVKTAVIGDGKPPAARADKPKWQSQPKKSAPARKAKRR